MNTPHHHYRVGGHLFSLALPPELVPAAALFCTRPCADALLPCGKK